MSDPTHNRLKVSREGIVLIKSFEGFRPRAVQGDDGRWVIGYGHTASAREGLTVGEQDAELLLQYDLMPVVKTLNDRVAGTINQHQFDALASFVLSVGVDRFLASDVLHRLDAGQPGQAADALIGWPEPATAENALRRRAAERALFVATPGAPVALADLLAAPLPPPPPPAPGPAITPEAVPAPAEARAAAVASLLGEPVFAPTEQPETPVEDLTSTPAAEIPDQSAAETPPPVEPASYDLAGAGPTEDSGAEPEATTPADAPARVMTAAAAMQFQRYSPYSASVLGPLPGFPPSRPAAPQPTQPVEPTAESPDAIAAPETVPEPEPAPASPAEVSLAPPAMAEPVLATPTPVEPEPEPAPIVPVFASPPSIDLQPFAAAPAASSFPPLDAPAVEPLVLTPATEADFAELARPTWPADQRLDPVVVEESPLFEAEPALSILRHEVEPTEPRRFDWGETGMYLVMGGLGLASCAFSAAAFRLSVVQPSPMGETTVIAWALALIGVLCVGVSSWNLYLRWGKR